MTRAARALASALRSRPARCLAACLLAAIALGAALRGEARAVDSEVRALWVTRLSLVSPESIAALVRSARDNHFNTLLVQVRARGDAFFANGVEPRAAALDRQPAAFDPLATVLALARPAGIQVHAWVNVNLVASAVDLPASRNHVVHRHPEWLMVPRAIAPQMTLLDSKSRLYLDKLARWVRNQGADVEGLYLSPIPQGAADYVVEVISDLAARYAIDGVHVDYARYPSEEFDYSRDAVASFTESVVPTLPAPEAARLRREAAVAPLAYVDALPDRWRAFRRERLTVLVNRLAEAVRTWRPGARFSAAVYPDAEDAAVRHLQDWRTWLANGSVDVICPMAYATDVTTFTTQLATARAGAGKWPLWAGIGAYRLSSARTVENIQIARRAGADGIVLFSYDSLINGPSGAGYLAQVGQAAFTR